jgi:hypothetical protein
VDSLPGEETRDPSKCSAEGEYFLSSAIIEDEDCVMFLSLSAEREDIGFVIFHRQLGEDGSRLPLCGYRRAELHARWKYNSHAVIVVRVELVPTLPPSSRFDYMHTLCPMGKQGSTARHSGKIAALLIHSTTDKPPQLRHVELDRHQSGSMRKAYLNNYSLKVLKSP